MNSSVINGSSFIHEYRYKIAHAIDELQLNLGKTERAIETVGESWKDDNFREFQDNFNQNKEQIVSLCKVLDNYQCNLLYQLEKKLERLERRVFKL